MIEVATCDQWCLPPGDLALAPDEIHLWRTVLSAWEAELAHLAASLAPEERERAERFHRQADRDRFIAAHGLLRLLLSRYTDIPADEMRFSHGPHGKPELAAGSAPSDLTFNLSHSHQVALFAVGRGRRVGVDVEQIRGDLPCEQVAARFFAPREAARLLALPTEDRPAAFYSVWTGKEAYAKALGEGLSLPLSQIEVDLAPGRPARLVNLADEEEVAGWSAWMLAPGPGYAGALVAEGRGLRVSCWDADVVLG